MKRPKGGALDSLMGRRRENARVGVRNHVLILPVDDLSNAACESVANSVKGTLAIPHAYGRLQFGADLDLHFVRSSAAAQTQMSPPWWWIGIEDQWTNVVFDGIAKIGKPVVRFGIESHGFAVSRRSHFRAAKAGSRHNAAPFSVSRSSRLIRHGAACQSFEEPISSPLAAPASRNRDGVYAFVFCATGSTQSGSPITQEGAAAGCANAFWKRLGDGPPLTAA